MVKNKSARISTLGSRTTSVISVSLVLLVLGVLAYILVASHNALASVRSSVTLIVRVAPGLEEYDMAAIKQTLNKAPYALSHKYTSADEVLAQESAVIGPEAVALLDENPYSAEFEVKLRPQYANPDSIKIVVQRLSALESVDDVIADSSVVADVDRTVSRISLILAAVALALLLISIVLINNTVSLSIYSRRFIIHTMKLVGADRSYIRRPFTAAGAACGLVASLVACVILYVSYLYFNNADPETAAFVSQTEIICILAAIFITGILITTITAWLAANRYLNKNYDQLFRK